MAYSITSEGRKQLKWNKGWRLTGVHRVILRYLNGKVGARTGDQIWSGVKHSYTGFYRSNLNNGLIDLADKGYIKKI